MSRPDDEAQTNHARDRLSGRSGDRFDLGYAPGPGDFIRWTLANAERTKRQAAEEAPAPPGPESEP